MGKCRFRTDWLLKKDKNGNPISSWSQKHSDSELFCKICACVVNVQNKGFHSIMQHADTAKHIKLADDVFNNPKQLQLAATSCCSAEASSSNNFPLRLISPKESATTAELLWTLKAVSGNFSAASCHEISNLFSLMFPGDISKNFSLSPKKMHYLLTDAIAPYFKSILLKDVNSSPFFVISFDETTNVEDKKELQITIRYWSNIKNEVVSNHLQTFFIGKADADTVHKKILSAINEADLSLQNVLMIGSDGPNVNKKVLRLLNEDLLVVRAKGLVDMGTCPIHIVHNAFLKGIECLGENAVDLVISVYHYFDGWPSRCEEYRTVQESLNLPIKKFIKHSSTRWLTFGVAASRLMEQWEGVLDYFLKYIPLKKNSKTMQSSAYRKIAALLQRPSIKAEVNFTASSAELFSAFTRKFQQDEPLVHMLCTELHKLVQTLVGRVSKPHILKEIKVHIVQETLFETENVLPLNEIVVPGEVKNELSCLKSNDRSYFLKSCQTHYITACKYLLKTANFSKLAKALRFLQPAERKLKRSCSDIITVSKALPINIKEEVLLDEWKLLQIEDEDPSISSSRIENYWNQFFKKSDSFGSSKFSNVERIVKAALTLSHGNADVERRFSVSRWALTEDKSSMSERTLNAILTTKDAVKRFGSPHLVPITRELINLAHCAYKSYQNHLDDLKKKKEIELRKKEKALQLERELQEKKKNI